MADDPRKRGTPDRSRVSQQPHEVRYLQQKFDLPAPLVRRIIEQEGPNRQDVEGYLSRMKTNRK
jgi:hypothetical protein